MNKRAFSDLNLTLVSLVFLLVWDLTSFDLILANLSYDGSFTLRHNFLLQTILHDYAQKFAWFVYLGLVISCIFPHSIFKNLTKLQKWQLILMPLVSILVITIIKSLSNTSCPWHLEIFGRTESYSSHLLNFFTTKNGAGKCFPAGHATSGFAFIGGFFIWRKSNFKLAQIWLLASLSFGVVLGVVQQIRGAHFMSHTLWGAWFCWTFSYITFTVIQYFSKCNKTKLKTDFLALFDLPIKRLYLIIFSSLYLTICGNLALFSKLQEYQLFNLELTFTFSAVIFCLLNFILGILAYKNLLQISIILLLLITAFAAYFTRTYGILIDPSMIQNVLQTDTREAFDLISNSLIRYILFFTIIPIFLLIKLKVIFIPFKSALWRNLLFSIGNLLIAIVIIWLNFQHLAASMRTHKDLRYLLNPLSSIYSVIAVSVKGNVGSKELQSIGEDAILITNKKPKLVLLVIGETARSANFSLNGYQRKTNFELEKISNLISFSNVFSCGTSTAESLPCMFSHLDRKNHIKSKHNYSNLLDVLDRAGLAVLWLDNQSGCKGVCSRITNFEFNNGGFDLQMTENIAEHLAKLNPQKMQNGVVIVMHQMGSHGPAYHLRSPNEHKKFMPECTSSYLSACNIDHLRNVYDNSIVYTDYFLAQNINWLKTQSKQFDTALVYISDHGESLGERNIYLHGMPYAIAPKWQKHVPMITWFADEFMSNNLINYQCLSSKKDNLLNHDYLFHSVLSLMNVQTKLYKPKLDIFADCKN